MILILCFSFHLGAYCRASDMAVCLIRSLRQLFPVPFSDAAGATLQTETVSVKGKKKAGRSRRPMDNEAGCVPSDLRACKRCPRRASKCGLYSTTSSDNPRFTSSSSNTNGSASWYHGSDQSKKGLPIRNSESQCRTFLWAPWHWKLL